MGNCLRRVVGQTEYRLVMVGLDGAGKTTTLYSLKTGGESVPSVPTIGFNVEIVQYKGAALTIWDLGGQEKLRGQWNSYFQHTHGVLFVVDSADRSRFAEVRRELQKIAAHEHIAGSLLVVLANKQDLPGALNAESLTKELELPSIRSMEWSIFPCTATTGEGLFTAMDWLIPLLKKSKRELV